ncbi:testis-expressed protein 10 [Leptopilina boulardi]|uniref:testis-expressed protein 10 n=1 Tax=Leptopilina boulardi TaxID=63433 RepID=UPI0021F5CB86|nr:testis-expressed protein 10 [Leptopilina boulardi]
MGKNNRHIKNLKSEKAKIKLKTSKKSRQLPKGQNVTNTSFKSKKIVIQEQLKQQDSSEIVSRRKLNVKELLTRLQHYNSTVRQDAVRELKEILNLHSNEILRVYLNSLLQGICALTLDRERAIRRESLKVLSIILSPISREQLTPFIDILLSYLNCCMTHINPNIKEDSLLFLDVLIKNCGNYLAQKWRKILPNFLEMISKLNIESSPGRQLLINLNSQNTSSKWRIKVLTSLVKILTGLLQNLRAKKLNLTTNIKTINATDKINYAPIYSLNLQICELNLTNENNFDELNSFDLEKYINSLWPLLFDSWLEIYPNCNDKLKINDSTINNEAGELLKNIFDIFQLFIDIIEELFEYESNEKFILINFKIKMKFYENFVKNFIKPFPFERKLINESRNMRRRQNDLNIMENKLIDNCNCLEQNLAICRLFIWFTTIQEKKNRTTIDRELCGEILQFLNEKMDNWSNRDTIALSQLLRTLRTLFLQASKIWYQNRCSLRETLKALINLNARQTNNNNNEIQLQCFALLSEIAINHNLKELHSEVEFVKFIKSLPSLLLKETIQDNVIQTINTIVLRFRKSIENDLIKYQKEIIENAKKIEIHGTEDERTSRLMILNLFYFIDNEIYH